MGNTTDTTNATNATNAATICGIGHLAMNARDMEKTLNFYCGVLGLKHAFTLRDAEGNPWIEYLKVADSNFIELFYPKSDISLATNSTYNHVCLRVEDIHAAEKALDGAGWEVDIRPKQGADANWQMWVRDPDGNRIELMQISPDSPQAKA